MTPNTSKQKSSTAAWPWLVLATIGIALYTRAITVEVNVNEPGHVLELPGIFKGGEISIFVNVGSPEFALEFACDEVHVRCGGQPFVQPIGARSTWVWDEGAWLLLNWDHEPGSSL